MSAEIAALAAATRLTSANASPHDPASSNAASCQHPCQRRARSHDAERHLSAGDCAIVEDKLDAQDTRLAEAILGLTGEPLSPIPNISAPVPERAAINHQLSTIN